MLWALWAGQTCLALRPGKEEEKASPGGRAAQGRELRTKGLALDQAGLLSDDPQAQAWGPLPGRIGGAGREIPRDRRAPGRPRQRLGNGHREMEREEQQKGETEAVGGRDTGTERRNGTQRDRKERREVCGEGETGK